MKISRNLGKAVGHAMNGGKRVYKMESNETKHKEYTGPTAEELNRQMAEKQKSGQHHSKLTQVNFLLEIKLTRAAKQVLIVFFVDRVQKSDLGYLLLDLTESL